MLEEKDQSWSSEKLRYSKKEFTISDSIGQLKNGLNEVVFQ